MAKKKLNNRAKIQDIMVVKIQAGIISVGFLALFKLLILITVVGIKVIDAVLITRKVIISFVAVSFLGLYSCILFMAFKPNGVAALPRPRIFIIMEVPI